MKIPFLTLEKYAGKTLEVGSAGAASGRPHGHGWTEGVGESDFPMVFKKVRTVLAEGGESILRIASLDFKPINQFENRIFRVDGDQNRWFLKVLDGKPGNEGNRREVFAWRVLGFDQKGKRQGRTWIRGLPARVFSFPKLNAVMTPYLQGHLRGAQGENHEFPFVLTMLSNLNQTLKGLHENGLCYMDLCPDNVLYSAASDQSPVCFFLADMGSVKPLEGFQPDAERADAFAELLRLVGPERLTRAETAPPVGLYPECEDPRFERPHYDYHTLARTGMNLLGWSNYAQTADISYDNYRTEIVLEAPLEPTRAELMRAAEILNKGLGGESLDEEAVAELLHDFFHERSRFIARYLPESNLKTALSNLLAQRVQRYRTALSREDREGLSAFILGRAHTAPDASWEADLVCLQDLPKALWEQRYQEALAHVTRLAQSDLLRHCHTARQSLDFHIRAFKTAARGLPVRDELIHLTENVALGRHMDQIPEQETLRSLRRGKEPLGLLYRCFAHSGDTEVGS